MEGNITYSNNNIVELVNSHYSNYINLFIESKNYYNGIEIYRKRFPDVDGFELAYFHIISKEYNQKKECACSNPFIICMHPFGYNPIILDKYSREICPIRIIATSCLPNYFNRQLKIWKKSLSKNGHRERILCFDDVNDYLIVLEERTNGNIYFVTGYPIEYSNRKAKLLKEYENYKALHAENHITKTEKT